MERSSNFWASLLKYTFLTITGLGMTVSVINGHYASAAGLACAFVVNLFMPEAN